MKLIKFKRFLKESYQSERLASKIYNKLFEKNTRNITYENNIEQHFPIEYDSLELLKTITGETRKLFNDATDEPFDNKIIILLNRYFYINDDNKTLAHAYLHLIKPTIDMHDLNDKTIIEQLSNDFHGEFG